MPEHRSSLLKHVLTLMYSLQGLKFRLNCSATIELHGKLRLSIQEPINLNENASIGCFGHPNQPAEDTTDQCFVAGGGTTEYGGDHPEFIQSIRFDLIKNDLR